MDSPLLSIGMIVKNEIRCIERCMQSLLPLREAIPCQLVVADTGSTDGTREVVEKYADVLLDYQWNNDFAAARNAVLDRCTGKWYLTIDADEWLEDVTPLTDFLLHKHQQKCNIIVCVHRNYQNKALTRYGDFYAARIGLRRDGQLRYRDPIHEGLYYADGTAVFTVVLPQFILHHDGYMQVSPQHLQDKSRRNLAILQEEVKKRPDDLRLLVQCLQSSIKTEDQQIYVDRVLQLAPSQSQNAYSSIAYQNSMLFLMNRGMYSKVLESYEQWKKLWPHSPVLAVDGEAPAAVAAFELERYEQALEHIRRWKIGLRRTERGEDLDSRDRLVTQYFLNTDIWRGRLSCIEVQCLLQLERYSEADRAIQKIDLQPVKQNNRVALLQMIYQNADNLSFVPAFLQKCWALCVPPEEETPEEEQVRLGWKRVLFNTVKGWLQQDEAKALPLLASLHDSPLGLSAKLMERDAPSEIASLWAQVNEKDWEDMLPQAYFHTLELGLPFPDSFYHQRPGALREIAAAVAQNTQNYAARWARANPAPAHTLMQQQFQYDLTAAALQLLSPLLEAGEKDLCRILCDRFTSLAQGLLPKLYHPELVQHPDDWNVLSGMHQFGLWLCAAEQHRRNGDLPGYMRALHQGLQAASLMKDMVKFLMEQAQADENNRVRQTASPELLALAEKVRAILSQYPPDDPAVAALKQSDVYQKVAYLIEGMDVPVWGDLPQ